MLVASVSVNSWVLMPRWFNHAPWFSVHPIDIIFPVFVTLSGVGLAFANGRQVRFGPTVRRFVVLMVLGLAYNAVTEWTFDLSVWRVTGVLQLYAVVIAAVSLMHLVTKTWQGWALITVLLSLSQTAVLSIYGSTCPAGVLTPQCNPSGAVDTFLFGANHMYRLGASGHDPEGIAVIFGAMLSAAAGATVGHLLRDWVAKTRATGVGPVASVGPMLAAAGGFVVLSVVNKFTLPVLLGTYLPTMKRLWTAPFALSIAAGTTLVLLFGHLLLDRAKTSKFVEVTAYPLLALGRNSLLVYFGSHVLMSLASRSFGGKEPLARWFIYLFPTPGLGQVFLTAAALTFWVGLAVFLHKREIYIKP